MRLFCGLVILFITVYNMEGINLFIIDVISISISKSITRFIGNYCRTQKREYKILKIKYCLNIYYVF